MRYKIYNEDGYQIGWFDGQLPLDIQEVFNKRGWSIDCYGGEQHSLYDFEQ